MQFAELSLPSVTLGKFVECFSDFAEYFRHSVKQVFLVVHCGGRCIVVLPALVGRITDAQPSTVLYFMRTFIII